MRLARCNVVPCYCRTYWCGRALSDEPGASRPHPLAASPKMVAPDRCGAEKSRAPQALSALPCGPILSGHPRQRTFLRCHGTPNAMRLGCFECISPASFENGAVDTDGFGSPFDCGEIFSAGARRWIEDHRIFVPAGSAELPIPLFDNRCGQRRCHGAVAGHCGVYVHWCLLHVGTIEEGRASRDARPSHEDLRNHPAENRCRLEDDQNGDECEQSEAPGK